MAWWRKCSFPVTCVEIFAFKHLLRCSDDRLLCRQSKILHKKRKKRKTQEYIKGKSRYLYNDISRSETSAFYFSCNVSKLPSPCTAFCQALSVNSLRQVPYPRRTSGKGLDKSRMRMRLLLFEISRCCKQRKLRCF